MEKLRIPGDRDVLFRVPRPEIRTSLDEGKFIGKQIAFRDKAMDMEWKIIIAAVAMASAVLGGIFYGFSSFIMTSLGKLNSSEGMRAMQRINVDVFHPSFMGLFFGLPIVMIGLTVVGWIYLDQTRAMFITASGIAQVVGCFIVTAAGNVPLNNALEAADAETEASRELWQIYLKRWTLWNHLRTFMCIAAAALLLAAIL